jgi:hypothetical protein
VTTEVWYRHRLTCGCEYVTSEPLLDEAKCGHHDTVGLVVETKAHTWKGMRRVDLPSERKQDDA